MSSLPSNHSPLPPVPAEKELAGFPQPALLGMSAPANSLGSGNESQPVLGNKPQASSNCRGSCRSLASCAQLRGRMQATSVVAPPWTDGSCWDQELQGEAGPWEGWRSQGRRVESMVTLHTSFSSRLCLGHERCCCCPKKAKECVVRCHAARKAIFLRSFNSIFHPSSKYKSFLHIKLILLSNWASFIACGWILMNSSTLSLHKQQFLVRRAQLLLSPLILNMCRLGPSKELGMPRASNA